MKLFNKQILHLLFSVCGLFMCAAMTIGCYTTKAMAAGFNCTNKLTKVEKVICRSSRLSLLDDELNASYKLARNTSKHKGSLIAWQGNWIKYRNQCPDDICLYWSYLSALNHIRAYSDIYEDDSSSGPSSQEQAEAARKVRGSEPLSG